MISSKGPYESHNIDNFIYQERDELEVISDRVDPVVAVLGENIVDLVPVGDSVDMYRALPGGSPGNTAITAGRLATPCTMIARISADVFGKLIRQRLADAHVDDRHIVEAGEPSSLAALSFDEKGNAIYDFWLGDTADWQWKDGDLPLHLGESVRALHAGSLALYRDPGAHTLEQFLRRENDRGVLTLSFDLNIRPAAVRDRQEACDRTDRLIPLMHIVKASHEDIHNLLPGSDPANIALGWLQTGPAVVFLTAGQYGASAITKRGRVAIPATPVDVVDTVGAGDAFMGGLLYALWALELLGRERVHMVAELGDALMLEILGFACRVSAMTCGRLGADPPMLSEIDLRDFPTIARHSR